MHHVGRDELAHARRKSRRLLAVGSLSFGVGETNCSQGIDFYEAIVDSAFGLINYHLIEISSS